MSDTNIHALPIGLTFDGYRVLRVLGAGGFGITYLAEEVQIGRKVAIKEYLPQGFAARAADSLSVRAVSASAQGQFAWGLDRFRKEAATLVAFEHPNIVSVYRYFEANGTAYLVMQYVEGKPLDALISGGKMLAESEIEEVILPILDGLEQVHAAKFLHRDIKPANIYIRKDGRPVLLDFGAARQAFGTESKSITAIVSEGYAPFEQYEARGDQGPWTDIYAIGAVLYRCITGDRPPAAPERISARLRGTVDPMAPAREAGKGRYGARLLEAADRALSAMPADRPRDIGELRALLKGEGASRIPNQVLPSRAVPASQSTTAASAAAVPSAPATSQPKSRVPLVAGGAAAVMAAAVAGYFVLAPNQPPQSSAAPPTKVNATTPPAPTPAPTQPSADELAERAAKEAEADLAALKDAIGRGELARAKSDMAALLARIEEALKKRPGHPGLARVSAAARELQAKLAAGDGKGRWDQIVLHISLARYHLDQARAADREKRYAEARQLAQQAKIQLVRASEALAAEPRGSPTNAFDEIKVLRGEVDAFEQALAKRIAQHVAWLIESARRHISVGELDEAMKAISALVELDPSSEELVELRRLYQEARGKQP